MAHFLGTTEYMILLAIVRLGEEAYGAAILDEIESAAGRAPSSGSLSTALDRLEAKGLVTSRYEGGAPNRGGRPRRVMTITDAGRREMSATLEAFGRLRSGLPEAPGTPRPEEG